MYQVNGFLNAQNIRFPIMLSAACFVLGGCAIPAHNNTLIFAVKRDLGVGVSTPSAADQSVNITLGYKERQAAWVPLWANSNTGGSDAKALECINAYETPLNDKTLLKVSCKHGPKFVGDSDPAKGNNEANDAYSTFASFGGDLGANGASGGNAGPNANVRGKLASFFATGVAAQYLAKQTGIVSDVFQAKKEDETAPKPNPATKQIETIKKFIDLTKEDDTKPEKVRQACVSYLQRKAYITEKSTIDEMDKLSRKTIAGWTAALADSDSIKSDLPFLAKVSQIAMDEIDKQLNKKGRDDIIPTFCDTPKT
jgi:hypothetical protein